jgi:hypothetical protein
MKPFRITAIETWNGKGTLGIKRYTGLAIRPSKVALHSFPVMHFKTVNMIAKTKKMSRVLIELPSKTLEE